jgi:hypothetical protein
MPAKSKSRAFEKPAILRTIRTIIAARNDSFRQHSNLPGDLARSIAAGGDRQSGLSVHPAVSTANDPGRRRGEGQSNDHYG